MHRPAHAARDAAAFEQMVIDFETLGFPPGLDLRVHDEKDLDHVGAIGEDWTER